MGYGSYHSDVRTARSNIGRLRESRQAFSYSERVTRGEVTQSVHPDLNIKGKKRESRDSSEHPRSTPIVVAMDVTSSRGDDAKAIYAQVPSMLGSLKVADLVPGPQICWAAIGDANTDKAPLQVGQFESDKRIDELLSKIWMEEGGGGTGEESYELLAYYLARHSELDISKRGGKGYLFFTGDEAPYPSVSKKFVKQLIGDELPSDLDTAAVFEELQTKFHSFLIFPRSSMEERQAAIDSEIRKRLELAGGRFKDVSIRASLIWHNRNDLDLHCITPSGEHIFYGRKRGACRGELDVDRNVHGETTKPVENIRWAKDSAPLGKYRFYVENYAFHESSQGATPFKVELDIDGEIQTFEGEAPARKVGEASRQEVFSFGYDGAKRSGSHKEASAAYRDDVILGKWSRLIPSAQILRVADPASAVECMLGAIALQEGRHNLRSFEADMKSRKVSKARRDDVLEALGGFARGGVFSEIPADMF